tara:strand:- start:121 stop:516 length:396 start_codon:yes stop_codon:yes gene_type:complete
MAEPTTIPTVIYSDDNVYNVNDIMIPEDKEDSLSNFFDSIHKAGESIYNRGEKVLDDKIDNISMWGKMNLGNIINDEILSRILIGVSIVMMVKRNDSLVNLVGIIELVLSIFYPIIYLAMVLTQHVVFKKN